MGDIKIIVNVVKIVKQHVTFLAVLARIVMNDDAMNEHSMM